MSKIYISPSNQFDNMYSYGGTNEMEQCNRIAECLEKHLLRNGYSVKRASKGKNMNDAISESNSWGANVHIPIHTNAGGGKGPLVMVYSTKKDNMAYAEPIYKELLKNSKNKIGYGVRIGSDITSGGWMPSELSNTSAISIYCECEFHDDKDLAKWIIENVDSIAEAIAKGICEADGRIYISEKKDFKVYRVQVGAFSSKENATKLLNELDKLGYTGFIIESSK